MRIYVNNGDIGKFKELSENVINDPKFSHWELKQIAGQYQRLELNTEAMMIYNRIFDKLDENDSQRNDILNRQAELYIKLADSKSAVECYNQSAVARPNDPWINSNLADLYKKDGRYEKAIEEYCKGIKKSNNSAGTKMCCNQLARLVRSGKADFDSSALAGSLLDNDRSVSTLMMAADLYSVSDDIKVSENLINEALSQTTIDLQKSKIYDKWLNIVKTTGDEKLLDKTMREYFEVANEKTKTRLACEISNLSMKSGDYQKALTDNLDLIERIDAVNNEDWSVLQIMKNIAKAYMETGDKENAWKYINDTVKSSDKINKNADWYSYMDYARKLDKIDEAAEVLEDAVKQVTLQKKPQILNTLLREYKKSGKEGDIERLIAESDEILKNATLNQKHSFVDFYKNAGQPEKAISILEELSANGNKRTKGSAINRLYYIYKENNQLDKALEWAENQPDSIDIERMKANVYKSQGNYENAIEIYQKIIETPGLQKREKRDYINQLIQSASKSDDKEKIINGIINNIKKENCGRGKNATLESAEIYSKARMYDEAIDQIRKAKKLTKNINEVKQLNDKEAGCQINKRDYESAASLYEENLKNKSIGWEEQIAIHNKIVNAYQKANRTDKVKKAAENMVYTCKAFLRKHENGSQAIKTRFTLANAYKTSGDKDEACETLEKIIRKYPHTSHAKRAEEKLKKMN